MKKEALKKIIQLFIEQREVEKDLNQLLSILSDTDIIDINENNKIHIQFYKLLRRICNDDFYNDLMDYVFYENYDEESFNDILEKASYTDYVIGEKHFVEYLDAVKEQAVIDNKISDVLEKMSGSFVTFQCENKIYAAFILLLSNVFKKSLVVPACEEGVIVNTIRDLIEWVLYEEQDHVITHKDKKYQVDTPKKLYKCLKEIYI